MPNPNTDFSSGAVLTAAQQNRFPRGTMAVVTSQSNTLTAGILTGLTLSFTAVANRLYKGSLHIVTSSATVGSRVLIGFTGNITRPIDYTVASSNFNNLEGWSIMPYAAGLQTIQVSWTLVSGAISPVALAGNTHQFIIEDIGPT
jgi:hypothetical protein